MQARDHQAIQNVNATQQTWFVRSAVRLEYRLRPYLGWGVFLILALLAILPAFTLRINSWLDLGSDQALLEVIGPLSIATVWAVSGWKRPRQFGRHKLLNAATMTGIILAIGLVVITQATSAWIPGPRNIATAAFSDTLSSVPAAIVADWSRLGSRFAFWWAGVETGTAAQDNLIFLALAGTVVWLVGALSALLVRQYQNGLLASAPILWLLGSILLYSREGRFLFVFGLGLAIVLHLLTDHETQLNRWRELGFDYSPGLFIDRLMLVIGAAMLILTVAATAPNLYVQALVNRYYAEMRPAYDMLEGTADRLFPGVRGASRAGGGGLAGGLPNEFLLQAGPDLTDAIVMHVRTNDAPSIEYPYDSEAPTPPRHYMRGGTLSVYNGRGWSNPATTEKVDLKSNAQLVEIGDKGRKEVVQQVALTFNTQVLYAAPEPKEFSSGSRAEYRTPGDLVAIWGRDKSYTAVSDVPAVSEETLKDVRSWNPGNPLPKGYEHLLELPDTVTQRTVDLAHSLTSDQVEMYAQAKAIESYLRTFEYDLGVSAPPEDTVDVADYFLFDLQRGYCDYYATAFVVLARASGLPTRFATGFVPGTWNAEEGLWTITEAEAHSWPEVYFPEYGWIPFEPTAGRPELARIGLPQLITSVGAQPRSELEAEPATPIDWNWQMLFWLLPIGLFAWSAWSIANRLRRRNEDPWQTLVQWGGRSGRPMAEAETILEYGDGLAEYVVGNQTQKQDLARVAATEMREMSVAVSSSYYAPVNLRAEASARAIKHWTTLREYLRPLRRSR